MDRLEIDRSADGVCGNKKFTLCPVASTRGNCFGLVKLSHVIWKSRLRIIYIQHSYISTLRAAFSKVQSHEDSHTQNGQYFVVGMCIFEIDQNIDVINRNKKLTSCPLALFGRNYFELTKIVSHCLKIKTKCSLYITHIHIKSPRNIF